MAEQYRTGKQYADQAKLPKYEKLKYSDVDCQAFCELVLKDLGIRQANGAVYNWKGSNDMARNACSWIGTKEECIKKFGYIPVGAWAFMWDDTGNEKQRGYFDGKGNYSHIGIFVGDNIVRDSTRIKDSTGKVIRDGVANRNLSAFNRIGLCKLLDFGTDSSYNNDDKIKAVLSDIRNKLSELEGLL
ncbi:MAG: hypothetical protein IIZ93_07935 [Acidaminococcaceae bacterium]|nr:hypothetical protein [Acidaminococcaceae bacterium]